jgi:hypothetical protein
MECIVSCVLNDFAKLGISKNTITQVRQHARESASVGQHSDAAFCPNVRRVKKTNEENELNQPTFRRAPPHRVDHPGWVPETSLPQTVHATR